MPKLKPTRSVAEMPPQMRLCCEHLCAGRSDEEIAGHLTIVAGTVKLHLAAARKRTGTKTRGELARWCKAAGNVRPVAPGPAPYDTMTTTHWDGRQVEIMVDVTLHGLGERFPYKFLAEAARVRKRLFPDRSRQHPTRPADAATDQPGPNAGTSAPDAPQPDPAR